MPRKTIYKYIAIAAVSLIYCACKIPKDVERHANKNIPTEFANSNDTLNMARLKWTDYFTDPYLIALIDTALKNNQELNITLQEITIAKNEIRARKGEYLPFVGIRGGAGIDKVGRYTSEGTSEANLEIAPGKETPEPLPDYALALDASWEVDIWHKLRNAKKAAISRYLSTVEGKNFVTTNLIAEVASAYNELLAFDKQLEILKTNLNIQADALKIVRLQKENARITELPVRKFEAEVLKNKSLQYDIQQKITETENRINFLLARYPQPIVRNSKAFDHLIPENIHTGLPAQLLANRPDIKQAELELAAAHLDVKVARARFYPSLALSASIGYRAFDPSYFIKTPQSLVYSLAGELIAPIVNRNAIKATYNNANAKQIQAVYNYERAILRAYIEVTNEIAKIDNLGKSYDLKSQQVEKLTQSINISNGLFRSARADYMEVLLTQRDALESKFDMVETRKEQLGALVKIYQALGGGWNG